MIPLSLALSRKGRGDVLFKWAPASPIIRDFQADSLSPCGRGPGRGHRSAQISKDRMVRLNLSLEVSSLADASTSDRPTTLKRTVTTTVMAKDGSTVVIGGLIDDSFSQTEYRVPCLGDVPGLGWLFKTLARGSDKTNLFIFISPKVIQNPREAAEMFESKKGQIDQLRETQIKLYQGGLDGDEPSSIDTHLSEERQDNN